MLGICYHPSILKQILVPSVSVQTTKDVSLSSPSSSSISLTSSTVTDDITDVNSEFSREDVESADEADVAIVHRSETTARDDLDDRVNAALASPLASTLEPFRAPLSGYSSLNSSTSTASSALALSFPDPLTPSADIRADSERGVESPVTPPSAPVEQPAEPSPIVADVDQVTINNSIVAPDTTATTGSGAVDDAPMDPANPTIQDAPADDENDEEDNSLAPIHRENLAVAFGNSTETVLNAIHSHIVTHPWTTSIIISILAIILGSTVFTSSTKVPTPPSYARVDTTPVRANTVFITSAAIPTHQAVQAVRDSVVAAPVAVATPIVSVAKTPKELPDQTPGAGPSTVKAVTSPASSSAHEASSETTKPRSASQHNEKVQSVTSQEASNTATTRPGCATAGFNGRDSWESCVWTSLFVGKLKEGLARRKWKGKEKEDAPVVRRLESLPPSSAKPLLLEAARSLPTISSSPMHDDTSDFPSDKPSTVGYPLKELKALFYPTASSSKPSNEVMKVVRDAFQVALDALLSDILQTTSALLNDLNHVRRVIGDGVKSVQRHVESFYEETLEPMYKRNKVHVDKIKKEFHAHQDKAKKKGGKVFQEVAKRFGKAKANARAGREKISRSLKDRESMMKAVSDGQKWLEKDAKRKAGKIQSAFALRMEKLEAQRCAKMGRCDGSRKAPIKGKGKPVVKPARA
ncbi:hypothetical protein FRC02_004616 [Tulasnella sp. 418]|nr:hypothetical protein FRC02_004616 [Tulasnella sp. 418]